MAQDIEKKLLIFLSHADEDKARVRALCGQLRNEGFDPWLDEERLLPGQDWSLEIENALRASDAILLCFSSVSVAKEGYIQREFKRAMQYQEEKPEGTIFLIPIRLDPCELPYSIRGIQYVAYPEGYPRLVLALQARAEELKRKVALPLDLPPDYRPSPSSFRLLPYGVAGASPVAETHERLLTIGRAPRNMVVLADPDVSWEHGAILLMLDGYIYRHLSLSNPTTIRRKHEEYLLRPGKNEEVLLRNQDRLTIGKHTFIVEFDLISEDTGFITTHKRSDGEDDHG